MTLGAAGVFTFADPAFAATVSITDSADPAAVDTSYTYTVSTGGADHGGLDLYLSGAAATITDVTPVNGFCVEISPTFWSCANIYDNETVTVTVLPTEEGTVTLDAVLGGGTGSDSEDTTIVGASAETDLGVTVADSADPVALGATYTYTAAVTNNGPDNATGVTTATTLSGAARTIVSATSTQGTCAVAAATVTCTIGNLTDDASATITVTVEPAATGTVTATTTVTGTEDDPTAGNNSDVENTTINNGLACTITGTPGNDTLTGTNGADVICGLGGNDSISAGNGDDIIYAGTGNDTPLNGGNGNDTIYGQAGNDSSYGEDLLSILDNGSDTLYGGPGDDTLNGQNGNDTVSDTDGGDTDTLSGALGNDTINVQDGAGGDTANGGLGTDTCTTDAGDTTTSC